MTSQRDEALGHMNGDEMTDDPIVVERHDEVLGGPPVGDPEADDVSARDAAADDRTRAGYRPGDADELATDRPTGDELTRDEPLAMSWRAMIWLAGMRHRRRTVQGWSRTRHPWWSPRGPLRVTWRLPAGRRRLVPRRLSRSLKRR